MWVLDPANSPDLIGRLREHAGGRDFEVAWVGEGWRLLVEDCHGALTAKFPDYELLAIKQKFGLLEYQAFPRPWVKDVERWTVEEMGTLQEITDDVRRRSETICEWCGSPATLREERQMILTLCEACNARFADPPA